MVRALISQLESCERFFFRRRRKRHPTQSHGGVRGQCAVGALKEDEGMRSSALARPDSDSKRTRELPLVRFSLPGESVMAEPL